MSKNTLTYEERNNIITRYLSGESPVSLGKEYNVPTKVINMVIDNPEVRLQIEKKSFELNRSREIARVDEIKQQMLDFISTSLTEAQNEDSKIKFLDKIKGMLDSLDRINRLNRGEVTDNTQHTEKNIKIDVADIISKLDSPEKKREFLRAQLIEPNNEEENN